MGTKSSSAKARLAIKTSASTINSNFFVSKSPLLISTVFFHHRSDALSPAVLHGGRTFRVAFIIDGHAQKLHGFFDATPLLYTISGP